MYEELLPYGELSPQYDLIGYRVNKNVYNCHGVLVLPAQTVLTKKDLAGLAQQGIVLKPNDIENAEVLDLVESAIKEIKALFAKAVKADRVPIKEVHDNIVPIVVEMSVHPDLQHLLAYLEKQDQYTYRHSIAVSLFSRLIGEAKGLKGRELYELTASGFLHDIGKAKIPEEILNKPGKLTPEEFELVKLHTVFGYRLIERSAGTTRRQALVALQHHERENGSGYPLGLKGDSIDPHSKIVAVADVFHAMVSQRTYRKAIPFARVLQEMVGNAYGLLEPATTLCFLQRIMDMMIGCRVQLTDGTVGVIVMINPHDPVNPLIKACGEYIDLSKVPGLQLARFI